MAAGTVHWSDGASVIATCGSVAVHMMRRAPTLTGMRQVRRVAEQAARRWKGGGVSLSVLEATAVTNIDSDVRQEATSIARDFPAAALATVIEGSGFRVATGRALVAGIHLLSRLVTVHKVFEAVPDAAPWLLAHIPPASERPTEAELLATVAAARAELR